MVEEIAKEYITLIPVLFDSFKDLNKESSELSHLQNHVIEYMYLQNRALHIKDISTGLNMIKQQLTGIIKELEASGYLLKVPDSKDKRAVLVSLTSKGKHVQEEKWSKIYQKFTEGLAKLTKEEQNDLQFALHKVNILLNKMAD